MSWKFQRMRREKCSPEAEHLPLRGPRSRTLVRLGDVEAGATAPARPRQSRVRAGAAPAQHASRRSRDHGSLTPTAHAAVSILGTVRARHREPLGHRRSNESSRIATTGRRDARSTAGECPPDHHGKCGCPVNVPRTSPLSAPTRLLVDLAVSWSTRLRRNRDGPAGRAATTVMLPVVACDCLQEHPPPRSRSFCRAVMMR